MPVPQMPALNRFSATLSVGLFFCAVALVDELCPLCALPVPKDTPTQDRRVSMTVKGGKEVGYRCLLCAVAFAYRTKADLSIRAPGPKKGEPIILKRTAGLWSVEPKTAVFAYCEGNHQECDLRYRALPAAAAYDEFVQANRKLLKSARMLTLDEFLRLCK